MKMISSKGGKHCRRRLSGECIPNEMWLEILSRLPIKSLIICGAVCKAWKNIVTSLKQAIKVPVCGLLLMDCKNFLGYFCLKTKETTEFKILETTQTSIIHKSCGISSGYDKGPLRNLSFDLSPYNNPNYKGLLFSFDHGLMLFGLYDGTYEVHNVVTKEVFTVPKSPNVMQHGSPTNLNQFGAIIVQLPSEQNVCHFIVVRFCYFKCPRFEVYYSKDGTWDQIRLGKREWNGDHPYMWYKVPSGALSIGKCIFMYIMTNMDHGILLKLLGNKTHPRKGYATFPLPELVHGKPTRTSLWICDKALHLSYYNVGVLWLWKHPNRSICKDEKWTWIPQFVITDALGSSTLPFCKTKAQKYLADAINAGHPVVPLACLPDAAVIFVLVNSTIYSYNFASDVLEKIGEAKGLDIIRACPFKPCFGPMIGA